VIRLLAAAAPPGAPAASLPLDQVAAFVLVGLVLIVAAARVVGGLFVRVGQPRVVGEIVAGVLLGPSLLGPNVFRWDGAPGVLACDRSAAGLVPSISGCLFPAQARGVLAIVGQLGLLFFMFLVGLEFDLSRLAGRIRSTVVVGVGVVLSPLAAAFALTPLLYGATFTAGWGTASQPSRLAFTLVVAAMLAVTAFPVTVRILQEKGLDRTDLGVVAVAAAALVTVLMFLLVGVARGVANGGGVGPHLWRLVGTLAYLGAMFGLVRPALARLSPVVRAAGRLDTGHVAWMLVVVLASAYATDRIGINVIVGGFVAGMVMPARELTGPRAAAALGDLTLGVLLPVFLAVSGLQTDLGALGVSAVGGLAALLVAAVASKWLGGIAFGRLGGLGWSEANAVGVLMNCRGLLVLVVALIGLQEGVISAQLQVGGVLVALLTTAMTGPLVDRYLPAPARLTG